MWSEPRYPLLHDLWRRDGEDRWFVFSAYLLQWLESGEARSLSDDA